MRYESRKQRRLDNGLFWLTDCEPGAEPILVKAIDMAVLFAIILGFVCLLAWAQAEDARDAVLIQAELAAAESARADRYAKMLGDCMSGGPLWDKANNTAHFCGRVVSVPLEMMK